MYNDDVKIYLQIYKMYILMSIHYYKVRRFTGNKTCTAHNRYEHSVSLY